MQQLLRSINVKILQVNLDTMSTPQQLLQFVVKMWIKREDCCHYWNF